MSKLESMVTSGDSRMSILEKVWSVTAMRVGTVATGGLTAAGALGTGYALYVAATAASEGNGYAAAGAVGWAVVNGVLTFMGVRRLHYLVRKIPEEIRYMREH